MAFDILMLLGDINVAGMGYINVVKQGDVDDAVGFGGWWTFGKYCKANYEAQIFLSLV